MFYSVKVVKTIGMELTAEKVFVNFCSKINKIFTYPFVFSISFPKISQIFNLTRISHIGSYSNLIKKFSICNSTFNNMDIHILLIRDMLKDRSRITEYLFYLRFSKKKSFLFGHFIGSNLGSICTTTWLRNDDPVAELFVFIQQASDFPIFLPNCGKSLMPLFGCRRERE